MRTGVSAEAGRGRATVPPPKPHPQYTRRERRTRAKGSGVFAVGPSVPLSWDRGSSRGRPRSPQPLILIILWRRNSSRSGEAQSAEAACCGWAVTSLGWRPARRIGPCHPATPLGLAGGPKVVETTSSVVLTRGCSHKMGGGGGSKAPLGALRAFISFDFLISDQ